MGLFDLTNDERRHYVARMLNCNPNAPETWPLDAIERLLERAERAASERLHEDIQRMAVR